MILVKLSLFSTEAVSAHQHYLPNRDVFTASPTRHYYASPMLWEQIAGFTAHRLVKYWKLTTDGNQNSRSTHLVAFMIRV